MRAGFSQRELAARAGVEQSTVARIESGHADPAFSTLERLLATAGLDMRIHLEPADDHDAVLDAIDRLRSPEERQRVATGATSSASPKLGAEPGSTAEPPSRD